ncbi:MAG: chemotaxis protein, partial [Caulobacteraceae bacterium]|nr:chemotaxis protein [Caulobacteraceae bacterium]
HLRAQVLPGLIQRARSGGRVRVWSAGCSTGQEAYSCAMTILQVAPDAGRLDIKILATDIDPNVVAEGRTGLYRDSLMDGVPVDQRGKAFERDSSGGWQAREEMRDLVTFKELNLIGDWPMKGGFDVIFCRNVAIYFEEETQNRIWSRFAGLLAPGATLYIGHSERVAGPASSQLTPDGITTYRRTGGAA